MINLQLLEEKPDWVAERLKTRGVDAAILSTIKTHREKRSQLIQETEQLKSERNTVSKEIGMLKGKAKSDPGAEKEANKKVLAMKELGEKIRENDAALEKEEYLLNNVVLGIPNIPDDSVPVGADESANKEIKKWGEIKDLGFTPKDHIDLGENLGILDFERASKLSGARFALYKGAGATLERAIIQFMLDLHTRKHGYQEIIPPFLVNRETLTGTGNLPKFEEDLFKTGVSERELFLIPTAEAPLTNIYANEVVPVELLPSYFTAYTPCFRSEAGSHGKDTRGLIRQHQFQKVELVKICKPETSFDELEKLTADAEKVLETLDLPYRRVLLSTGDMSFASAKTYDLEVWLPGQQAYREISSCSNCTDFQSRRAKIRFKEDQKAKPQLVHTLNGSGLATGRTFIAILENFQNEKGEICIPKPLHRYIDGSPGFEARGDEIWLTGK